MGDSGVSVFKSPPVTRKKDPIVAIQKPMIFTLFKLSWKIIMAKIEIIIGANKHTNKAGSEGPINLIAEYWTR